MEVEEFNDISKEEEDEEEEGTFNGGNGFKDFGFAFLAGNIKFENGFSLRHGGNWGRV